MLDSRVQFLHSNISLGKRTPSHSFICWKLEIVWENKRIWKTLYAWISTKKCQRSKALKRKAIHKRLNLKWKFEVKFEKFLVFLNLEHIQQVIKSKINKMEKKFPMIVTGTYYCKIAGIKSWMNRAKRFFSHQTIYQI